MAFIDRCETAEDVRRRAAEVRARRNAMFNRSTPKIVNAESVHSVTPEPKLDSITLNGEVVARFQETINPYPPISQKRPAIAEVQRAVCKVFGVTLTDFLSARRYAAICFARQISYAICRRLTLRSFPEIGRRHGGRDHTTVIWGCNKVEPIILFAERYLSPEATLLDWVKTVYDACDHFPELYPFAMCGRSQLRTMIGKRT